MRNNPNCLKSNYIKNILLIGLLFFLSLPSKSYAWHLEGNILIIEKGDNLSAISHSLYGTSYDYNSLWKELKKKYNVYDPNKILPDWRITLPDSLLPSLNYQSSKTINIFLDSLLYDFNLNQISKNLSSIDTSVRIISNKFDNYKSNRSIDWANLIIGFFLTIIAGWVGWEQFLNIIYFIRNLFR
jgi:hypothetical protein